MSELARSGMSDAEKVAVLTGINSHGETRFQAAIRLRTATGAVRRDGWGRQIPDAAMIFCEETRIQRIGSGIRAAALDIRKCDLIGANLENLELTGTNLQGVALRKANLKNAWLSDSNLKDADLSEANVCGAYFINADMTGANLEKIKTDHRTSLWGHARGLWLAPMRDIAL